jgi:excinuclease UvrABC nuclease subunit
MEALTKISQLPNVPAIYAMYGGEDRRYVAYVGIGDNLRQRITQHLVNVNSSATTATGAVRLHPDHLTAVVWWEHASFADRVGLQAAELVAFDVLEP